MEGPSLIILKEELAPFLGQRVLSVTGNTKQPKELLLGRKLSAIDTWAKVLFLTFSDSGKAAPIVTKTHFLMFGSYRINDPKSDRSPRLELKFKKGVLYFYACSIQFEGQKYLEAVDRQVDLMSDVWSKKHVLQLLEKKTQAYLCDLFLDQGVFAGSGNIVKNEVLFNLRRHPLTPLAKISRKDWPKLAQSVREYCFKFYEWKKQFMLRKHWQVYKKFYCPLCAQKLRRDLTGRFNRRSFFCEHCQLLPTRARPLKVHKVLPMLTKPKRPRPEARLDH